MNYKKTVLKNGLRIITVPMRDTLTTTVSIIVEAGSEYETVAEAGISHFLEHMCFKGTLKRPTAAHIWREIDGIGAENNAFTSNEYTSYYAKSDHRHVDTIIDIVSDVYLNSTFPVKEIEKEKGVVIEELNMYEDLPARKVYEVLVSLMYGTQPAGRPIIGTRESINAISRKDIIRYRHKHYVPEATIVVVSGKFDEKKVLARLRAVFSPLPKKNRRQKPHVKEEQEVPQCALSYKKTDQSHLLMGFRGFARSHEAYWPVAILSTLLSGGGSSRLWHRMREELGICYYIDASPAWFTNYGSFLVSAGVANNRLEEAVAGILTELKHLKTDIVSEQELKKAKDYKIGHLYLGLESSDAVGDFYGYQEAFHEKIIDPDEVIRKIQAVTAQEVHDVAERIFTPRNLNLAVIGPHKDTKKFQKLLVI